MAKIISVLILIIFCRIPAYADPISITIGTTAISMAWSTIIAATAAIAATAIGVTSSVMQANQQKAVANYQRQVNEQNARASREAAQAKIVNQRRQLRFMQGTQLARLGGMGALSEGSPLDIMGQTAGQAEYDNMMTEYEGEVQAIQFQQQAALNKYQADIADYNLGLNVTGQVVKGIGSVGSSILGGVSLGASAAKNVGDFTTSTGGAIDIGKDYMTGNMIT